MAGTLLATVSLAVQLVGLIGSYKILSPCFGMPPGISFLAMIAAATVFIAVRLAVPDAGQVSVRK